MNMVCVSTDWRVHAPRRAVIEVRQERVRPRPANRAVANDPHQKVGSFAETAPEDREEFVALLEEAFAGL